MPQYIDKAAAEAAIKRIIDEMYAGRPFDSLSSEQQKALWYVKSAMSAIRNIEAKEVDLEKEIKEAYLKYRCYGGRDNMLVVLNEQQFSKLAKHFFERGLNCKYSHISIPSIDDTLKEMGIDPDSKEANNFKNSYYKALDKFKEKEGV